jgi:hypothetical protein
VIGGYILKRVVSVSLGSARRDHRVQVELLGEPFEIARRGTDGDFDRAVGLLKELDGKVDAIGLGGIDVFLFVRQKRFAIQDGLRLMESVKITPVVDGSGLKNTLEREVVRILARETNLIKKGTKVLMVSSVDRFGMAEAMSELGCDVTFGDLIFTAGIPYPIKTVEELEEIANKILPEIAKMPFHMIYPTGKKQESQDEAKVQKFAGYYQDAENPQSDHHSPGYLPDLGYFLSQRRYPFKAHKEEYPHRHSADNPCGAPGGKGSTQLEIHFIKGDQAESKYGEHQSVRDYILEKTGNFNSTDIHPGHQKKHQDDPGIGRYRGYNTGQNGGQNIAFSTHNTHNDNQHIKDGNCQ